MADATTDAVTTTTVTDAVTATTDAVTAVAYAVTAITYAVTVITDAVTAVADAVTATTDAVTAVTAGASRQGEHGGNLFSLLLRHADAEPAAVRRAVAAVRRRGFVNYFGHQRSARPPPPYTPAGNAGPGRAGPDFLAGWRRAAEGCAAGAEQIVKGSHAP